MQFKIIAGSELRFADEDWVVDGLAPVPPPSALLAYARCSHREIKWLLGFRGDRIACLLPFYVERRRISGVIGRALSFAGSDFFDYIPLYCSEVPVTELRVQLGKAARSLGADVVYLNKL